MAILIGLIGLAIFVILVIRKKNFIKKAVKTEGKIVEVEMKIQEQVDTDGYGSTKTKMYTPRIEFTDSTGQQVVFLASTSTSSKRKYKVGKMIDIMYDPEKPQKAQINKFFALWGFPIIVLLISVIILVAGIFAV